ncbi:hypothetical protein LCGC14_1068670, partial [marine sediment metagenome]
MATQGRIVELNSSIVGLVSPALLLEQLTCSGYVTPIR